MNRRARLHAARRCRRENVPMDSTAIVTPEDDFFVLSNLPPSRAQKWLALVVVVVMLVGFFIAAGPLSRIQTSRVAAFVPAYTTAMVLSEAITAVLLYTQFAILRTRGLLVMSSGYLFAALMPISWILMFPGVFVPEVLIGGIQSRAYIYFFWHAGFPIFVIFYALLKDAEPSERFWRGTVSAAITLSIILTVSVVLALAVFFSVESSLLPRVELDPLRFSPLWLYFAVPMASLIILALVVLWIRRRSILDLWLIVVLCAYLIEIFLSYFPVAVAFGFGWYAGRIFGLLSSSIVLLALLYEIMTLYARLLQAVHAQRREREARLMTGDAVAATIAHEVKQPLSGMITSADAGLRFLDRSMPDLDEAKDAFKQIVADGHRAAAVIGNIRTIFKKEGRNRTSFDINNLISETLVLVREDLDKHRVVVKAELDERLPPIIGDRIQLQQVLVNLITNAIDSMAAVGGSRVLSVKSAMDEGGEITVSVADTGTGIGPQAVDRIFNPLFTTKADGMGMGLSICRSIIEAHDGRLWATPNTPRGAVFHFTSVRTACA
jgi:signal transduction histidine kinase